MAGGSHTPAHGPVFGVRVGGRVPGTVRARVSACAGAALSRRPPSPPFPCARVASAVLPRNRCAHCQQRLLACLWLCVCLPTCARALYGSSYVSPPYERAPTHTHTRVAPSLPGDQIVENSYYFYSREPLAFHTSVYFVIVSITSTGYGDISPKSDTGQAVVIFMLAWSFVQVRHAPASMCVCVCDAETCCAIV